LLVADLEAVASFGVQQADVAHDVVGFSASLPATRAEVAQAEAAAVEKQDC
jgi:hypothetical protein